MTKSGNRTELRRQPFDQSRRFFVGGDQLIARINLR
jgi:hypothetical protein